MALEASARISTTLNNFPAAARERIPALYSSLTCQAFPDLTSQDLFGSHKRFGQASEAQTPAQAHLLASKPSGFGFGKAMNDKIAKKAEACKLCKEIATKIQPDRPCLNVCSTINVKPNCPAKALARLSRGQNDKPNVIALTCL